VQARPETLEALLRCPGCGGELALDAESAVCAGSVHRYPVVEGIPVFVDEETIASDPQYAGQRSYFDSQFRGYEQYSLENWRVGYLDRLSSTGVLDGSASTLVDVGVGGSGYTVIEAARAGWPAIGCDLSLEGSSPPAGSPRPRVWRPRRSGSAAPPKGFRRPPDRPAPGLR
jgi:uncharacterized protein YbaR (Trm112 family)